MQNVQEKVKLWTFDTEDNSRGKAFLFNFYDIEADKHYTFTERDKALWFLVEKESSQFWAVNLEYDLNNLFAGYHNYLEYTFAGSRLISAKWKGSNRKKDILFYDTLNHWKIGVKEMGKRIGLPKLEVKHTVKSKATKRMIEYCKRDTEITGKFLKLMVDNYEKIGCKLKATVASTTLEFFEREYVKSKRLSHSFTNEQIDFFHEGYYGGRTEIFFTKPIEGKIWYHDINSLYPYCLKTFEYPNLSHYVETLHPNWEREGIARIEISSSNFEGACYLPTRHQGKLVFPTGRWTGVYTYFEIRRALHLGYTLHRVDRAIEFVGKVRPFRRFIEAAYQARLQAKKKGDELLSQAYKDLMNHLYGKFAQGREFTKLIPLPNDLSELKTGDEIIFNMLLSKKKEDYPRYANCIWSCYCTAYARDLLFKALQKVQKAGQRAILLYCDTDSVLYESKTCLFPESSELGAFKLEGIFDYAYFKLPKLYALRQSKEIYYKAKGVPQTAKASYFETGKAEFKRPYKLREALRRNLSPKRKIKLIPNYWEIREKSVNQVYNKRISDKYGFTIPIVVKGE